MLYHLMQSLSDDFSILNVGKYITFRSIVGLLTSLGLALLLSPRLIRFLSRQQLGQVVRNDGPKSHFSKAGTPTMGGVLIVISVVTPSLLWMNWSNLYLWMTLGIFIGYSAIGFWDDFSKISAKSPKGISGRTKILWQTLIAGAICTIHYYLNGHDGWVTVPFLKQTYLSIGVAYIFFSTFVIVGASNAVNLTDGLDGLAIGPVMIAAACYGILSYVSGHSIIAEYLNFPFAPGVGELAIIAACLVGASMGFLWYNTYPAQVFMGDVGSLPLGGILGALAVFSRHELLLVIVGGVFVAEALSVMAQVISFKLTGKRVFRMAPIHHHFELKGWPEPRVIVRFWIIAAVLALISLLTLKVR